MLTLKNYERSANSHLRPLCEHIFFSRDPMLSRLNLATLHQLLAPTPKANSNASTPSRNQKRTLNLIDLEITHPCFHDHTGSLRDLLQSHLLLPKRNWRKSNNHSLKLTSIGVQCYPSRLLRTSWPIRSPSQQPHRRPNTITLHTYTLTPLWFSNIYILNGFTKQTTSFS